MSETYWVIAYNVGGKVWLSSVRHPSKWTAHVSASRASLAQCVLKVTPKPKPVFSSILEKRVAGIMPEGVEP